VAVAVAAWLADLSWPAVVGVMTIALAIAWLVEWVSWRDAQVNALAPRPEPRRVVEEAHIEPEPEPKFDSAPMAERRVNHIELHFEPVSGTPPALDAPEPEPPAPAPVDVLPEPEPVESVSVPEPVREPQPAPEEVSEPVAPDAPVPRARRAWRGMSFRRVDSGAAVVPPAPADEEPAAREPAPTTANEVEPPASIKPEPRPAYAPPRAVPTPPPRDASPVAPRAPANVVRMRQSTEPREWNLWDLETLAREQARLEPERGEEWSYLFVHLRQFANARGRLPSEFDGLVRESFGELLETLEPA
jgi:hypothetical protein